jgi:tetratricopeptide (TPR) repeat protein
MPPRSQKDDDGRKKLNRTFSRFFGRSRSQAPPPSPVPVPVPETTPPVPAPAPPPTIVPPSVQPPAPAPVPANIPTAAPQPSTSSHDPRFVSSAPAAPSSVVGKVDANIPAPSPSPRPPISPPASTPVPPALKQTSEAIRAQAENFKIRGDCAANSGEFQDAVYEYSRAIQLQPSNAEYLANRSYAYLAMSRYHDSLADAQASVAAKPTYSNGWRKLGAAHRALRQYAEAKIAYTEALRTQKSVLVAETIQRDLAQVTRLLEETSTSRSATTRPSVTANTSSLRPPTSVLPHPASPTPIPSRPTLFTSPPMSSISSFSPPVRPATVTASQVSPRLVSTSTNQARPLSPQSPVSVSQEPSASITSAQSVPTPATFRTVAHPSTPAIPSAGATTSSESARKAEVHKTLGNEAVASKDFQKAIDQYTRAIQLDPSSAVYLANRSYAYMALSKYEDARIDAEKAVVADPTYWKGWARFGAAHKALKKYSEAKTAFEQALMLGPTTGAEITRLDLAEVTRLLEAEIAVNSILTSQPTANIPSVISPTVTATITNRPSPRAPALLHSQTSVSSPTPLSSTFTPPQSAPSSHARRPTPTGPAPLPPRSIPVSASQDSAPRPAPTTQPTVITANSPADHPPVSRPGEISPPDHVDNVDAAVTEFHEFINGLQSQMTTPVPYQPIISSPTIPRPESSILTPPRTAPSSQARHPTSSSPASAPVRSIPVSASQDSAPRSAPATQSTAITANPPADPPPAYRPGEISSPDPVVAAVAEQELDRELDELERKIAARNTGALSFGSISSSGFVSFFVSLTGRETQYTWDKDLDLVKIAHPAFGKIAHNPPWLRYWKIDI